MPTWRRRGATADARQWQEKRQPVAGGERALQEARGVAGRNHLALGRAPEGVHHRERTQRGGGREQARVDEEEEGEEDCEEGREAGERRVRRRLGRVQPRRGGLDGRRFAHAVKSRSDGENECYTSAHSKQRTDDASVAAVSRRLSPHTRYALTTPERTNFLMSVQKKTKKKEGVTCLCSCAAVLHPVQLCCLAAGGEMSCAGGPSSSRRRTCVEERDTALCRGSFAALHPSDELEVLKLVQARLPVPDRRFRKRFAARGAARRPPILRGVAGIASR